MLRLHTIIAAICLILAAITFSTANANLIVHKSFKEKYLIRGKNATVSIVLYNQGAEIVKNVFVEDKTFRNLTTFAAVAGKHSKKIATIAPQATASFSFIVKPVVAGELPDHPAVYKYQVDNETHSGYSSSQAAILVLTEQEAARLETRTTEWSIFFVASLVVTGVPLYLYLQSAQALTGATVEKKTQ
ncbi:hypothetical protein HDU76_004487 [Blyttiomyces sp. JEL0837]|nr:hypothetical protein HDU76_004487 [Blyttiomyces sp. JEL0837]